MVQEYSVLKIEPTAKKFVIQFQSLIQSKTGKYISQGRAAGLACGSLMAIIETIPFKLHKKGEHKNAELLDWIRDAVLAAAEECTEGKLEDFDFENIFDYS